MEIADVKTVGVVGGGVMGSGIVQSIIQAGYKVFCLDLSNEVLAKTRDVIVSGKYGLKTGVARGKITQAQADSAITNFVTTTRIQDLAGCDIVIESIGGGSMEILEDRESKKRLFAQLDGIVKNDAIFSSNTSFLTIATLAEAVKRKDKFLGTHFFRPPVVLKAVELTYTPYTSEETLQLMEAFFKSTGKVGVRVKDMPGDPGFIGNRLHRLATIEARKMVEQGICTQQDIDTVMELGYGWTMGIFGMNAAFTDTRRDFGGKK